MKRKRYNPDDLLSELGKMTLLYDKDWPRRTIALAGHDGLGNLKVLIITPSMWNDADDVLEALKEIQNNET